ncbi:MAG: DUF885 family protein [Gammaproteobacteria bacterium]|nr:DUF885 family protein [Gammaproteobacteria bacterium]
MTAQHTSRTGRWRCIVPAILLVAGGWAHTSPSDETLQALMEDFWEAQVRAAPLAATLWGENRYRDRVDDLSPEALAARVAGLDDTIARLGEIDEQDLSPANREQFEAFEWMLAHERRNLDFDTRYFNINSLRGWHSGFADVILATPYSSEQDYRDLLERMKGFGAFAQQNLDLMRAGIESGYTQPCESLGGYGESIADYVSETPEASVFAQPFADMPESIAAPVREELRADALRVIDEVINPGYRAFADFFAESYEPACRNSVGLSSLPGGREAYDHALRYYTSLDTDAPAIHALGRREVGRIRREMQAVMAEVDFEGDLADFLAFLRSDPQFYAGDEESYLHRIAWIAKTIEARLPRFFSRLPSNPYGISVIPEQIAPLTTTAYYQPGAGDGTRAGQYFVNLYDLPSRPLYELPALSLHEAVPGHHLQISFQGENRDLPDWRRFYYFHAFGEGWGLYSEFLGEEMGIYTTPYERFGRLIYDMWRAARLVVDTGLHARGWTREQAIDFMLANTGLTRTNVIAEVDRYITYPGQATAYKHGELKIRELRLRAENTLGEAFDLRDFHVQVVSGGSLPLTVLDRRIQRWIDARAEVAHHDLIIRGGTLYDGSGRPGKKLDLAITGDRITAIGELDRATANRIVDATDMAVSPGFINMLSWAPTSLIDDGRGLSDLVQGVTLEVFGEGISMGPVAEAGPPDMLARLLGLDDGEPLPWQTLGEYLQWLENRGVSPNVASFVGATTLRMHQLGADNRAPTPEEMQAMRDLARQAMEEGAMGLGSSLIYPPAFFASTEELIELASVVGEYGGMYISHMRSEGNNIEKAVSELITIAREAGVPAEIYHLKFSGKPNWDKFDTVVGMVEAARAEGLRITADMYTYVAGATGLAAVIPPWASGGGTERLLERLGDPETRARILDEMRDPDGAWENLLLAAGPEGVLLTDFESPELNDYAGKTLAEVAAMRGTTAEEAAVDLVVADSAGTGAIYFIMSEHNMKRKVALPWLSFGSDAAAVAPEGELLTRGIHPRTYGTFARLLGKYVREEQAISLEEAIRKLTALPADNLGIAERGRLRTGHFADVVVFDPETVNDHATWTEPHQLSTGVRHVFVNGEQVIEDGRHTGATPGRFIRGPGYRPR